MNNLKKAAEILVECGYAKEIATHFYYMPEDSAIYVQFRKPDPFDDSCQQKVNPFADTLEGRRQADAIEDWLSINHSLNWHKSRSEVLVIDYKTCHKWRLDRIKWCLDNLRGTDSPQLPYTPYEQKTTCSKCGMDFSGTTGYVCGNADCPMGLNGTTC